MEDRPSDWLSFLEKHYDKLINACRSYNGEVDPDMWDEILDRLPRFDQTYKPERNDTYEAYVWLSLRKYLAKRWHKNQKYRQRFVNECDIAEDQVDRQDKGNMELRMIVTAEVNSILEKAHRILTKDEYYVLYYATIGGYSMQEIADAKQRSRTHMYTLYHSAVKKLKERLNVN